MTEIIILTPLLELLYTRGASGTVSFGQAAFLGLGIYAPALLFKYYNIGMITGLLVVPGSRRAGAAFRLVSSRVTGLYFH